MMLDHDTLQIKMTLFYTSRNSPENCPATSDYFNITGTTWIRDPEKARRRMHKEIDKRIDDLLKRPYISGGVSSEHSIDRRVSRRYNNKGT